jgi:CRP-like cAMP-binding protein
MIDFAKFKNIFPFVQDLSDTDLISFFQHVKVAHYKAGETFLKNGSNNTSVYYVNKGLVRSFFINEKGEEITNRLRYEFQLFGSYDTIFFKKPSRFNFQALENSELYEIDFFVLQEILNANHKYNDARRFFITEALIQSLNALDDFILLTPEERYLKFMEENPALLNRVPIKYIANVLGITPVSLSRIRKRIALRKR